MSELFSMNSRFTGSKPHPKLTEIHLNFPTKFLHLTLLKYQNQITV